MRAAKCFVQVDWLAPALQGQGRCGFGESRSLSWSPFCCLSRGAFYRCLLLVVGHSRSVVVRAQAEGPAQTRRALIGGLMAAAVAVTMPQQAQAVDIIDATKVRQAGFDIIYEARDLDLPQVCN